MDCRNARIALLGLFMVGQLYCGSCSYITSPSDDRAVCADSVVKQWVGVADKARGVESGALAIKKWKKYRALRIKYFLSKAPKMRRSTSSRCIVKEDWTLKEILEQEKEEMRRREWENDYAAIREEQIMFYVNLYEEDPTQLPNPLMQNDLQRLAWERVASIKKN